MRSSIAAFVVVAVLSCPSVGHAEPITFTFSASVVNIVDGGPGLDVLFENGLTVGSILTGSYTFESSAPDGDAGPGGSFQAIGAPYGFVLDNSPYFNQDQVIFQTSNSATDMYRPQTVNHSVTTPTVSAEDVSAVLDLMDFDGDALSSASLPLTPPALAAFSHRTLYLLAIGITTDDPGFRDSAVEIHADITSLQVASVPEPSSLLLLGCGLAGLVTVKRRRQR